MKIAIVGSRRYENRRKIKEFIFKLKEEYGTDTIIPFRFVLSMTSYVSFDLTTLLSVLSNLIFT